jgi:hypothetical protein
LAQEALAEQALHRKAAPPDLVVAREAVQLLQEQIQHLAGLAVVVEAAILEVLVAPTEVVHHPASGLWPLSSASREAVKIMAMLAQDLPSKIILIYRMRVHRGQLITEGAL